MKYHQLSIGISWYIFFSLASFKKTSWNLERWLIFHGTFCWQQDASRYQWLIRIRILVDFPAFVQRTRMAYFRPTNSRKNTVWWCLLHISSYSQVSHLSVYIGFAGKKYDQPKKHPLATGYTLQRSTGFKPSYHSWLQILVKRSPETAVWIKMIKNDQCQLSIHIYIINVYIYIYIQYLHHVFTYYIYPFIIYIYYTPFGRRT